MSFQGSIVSTSNLKAQQMSDFKVRPTVSYHPSIWKDYNFLAPTSDSLNVGNEMIGKEEELKEEVRKMLISDDENPINKLKLVDTIQRLGVFYHFENEIHQVLEQIYAVYTSSLNNHSTDEDLNTTALRFRLLRQQGYRISCDIFSKFMDEDGKFKETLCSDARGILSLYEATHMRIHEEDLLEDALQFTTKHLQQIVQNSNTSLLTIEIKNALKLPIRKAVPRIKAREYIDIYEKDPSHNEALLAFSKLDFNLLQKLHQNELNEIIRWWKDLNVAKNFPFARDRIVECYFWILGLYFEPNFQILRKMFTKTIAMVSIMDDMYDAYGTFEELQVFTLAIKRWNISTIDLLPKYMKVYYTTLLKLFEDIDKETGKDGTSYRGHFAKEAMKKQAETYFKEVEWLNKKYKPNYEEYMEVALDSSGHELLSVVSFACMGEIATKEVFDWLSDCPKILEASNIICRLMDDIATYKFEKEREHVASAIECYMDSYGCSEEAASMELGKQVEDAWKTINECCFRPTIVPIPFLIFILNISRVMTLLYSDGDGYTNSSGRTKLLIHSLLVEPVAF